MRGIVAIATLLLGVGVVVIIGNTIRLDILNRRAEIEVTKLVGGSDGFVRRPFLYGGIWYGLGGAAGRPRHRHRGGRVSARAGRTGWQRSMAASFSWSASRSTRRWCCSRLVHCSAFWGLG